MRVGRSSAGGGRESCHDRANGAMRLLALSVPLAMAQLAHAGSYDFADGTSIDYRLTATYGAGIRIGGPASALINGPLGANGLPQQVNADDADRNFKKWSLINNRITTLFESNLKHGDFGLNFSADAFYDQVYRTRNDNDSPSTVNKFGSNNSFTDAASYFDGRRVRLLNAYAYGGWGLGDGRRIDFRVGNQVVAWGESLFFSGVASAQGPADATRANVPGAEVKDILLPVPQISTQVQITPKLSLLGYYQFRYKENEIFPVGDYFSTTDIIGPGAQFLYAAPGVTLPYRGDIRPRQGGQGGVGIHYLVTPKIDVGLYRLNYDDKNPSFVLLTGPTPGYAVRYFDNIKMTAASISTRVGDAQVSGEVTYRQGAAILVNTPLGATATRGNATQVLASMIQTFGHSWFADEVDLAAEVGLLHVNSVEAVNMGGANFSNLYNSRNSAAYALLATLHYPNVFNGWDLAVPIAWQHAVAGNASVAGAFGSLYGVGDKVLSLGANFTYLNNLEIGAAINLYLESANARTHPLADRSYITVHAKYTF